MSREKRTAPLRAWVTPSMKQQLELFVAEEGSVVSMSDYLFEVIEEHVAMRSIRVSKHKIGKRIGNQ